MILSNFTSFLPEITLLIILVFISFYRFFQLKNQLIYSFTFIIGLALTGFFVAQQFFFSPHLFLSNNISFDSFGSVLKAILLSGFILSSLITGIKKIFHGSTENIIYAVLIFSAFISVSSNNLLLTFAGFEILNLSYFSLLKLKDSKSVNLSSYYRSWLISSSLMLFGISVFFGLFGSLNYAIISDYLSKNPVNNLTLTISVLLVFIGFALKLFVFPFQSILTKIFAVLDPVKISVIIISSVISGSGAVVRFINTAFSESNSYNLNNNLSVVFNWDLFLLIIFCLSILSSAFILLIQKNFLKTILYYLLVNVQYVLITGFEKNSWGLIIYLMNVIYIAAAVIGTLCISNYFTSQYPITEIKDLKGLFKVTRLPVLFLTLFLLSIAGFPFTLGFTSRIFIFTIINQSYFIYIIAASIAASFISAIVLYKILTITLITNEKIMHSNKLNPVQLVVMILILFIVILFGLLPELMTNFFSFIAIN